MAFDTGQVTISTQRAESRNTSMLKTNDIRQFEREITALPDYNEFLRPPKAHVRPAVFTQQEIAPNPQPLRPYDYSGGLEDTPTIRDHVCDYSGDASNGRRNQIQIYQPLAGGGPWSNREKSIVICCGFLWICATSLGCIAHLL